MTEIGQNILDGCKNGNEECWRKVFLAYYPLAKWVVSHTLYAIDDYTVNSLAQEAMVALVSRIHSIHDEQYLKRFVKRVTRNKCIDYIRSHREVFEEVPEDLSDTTDTPLDDETIDALHEAVETLGEPCNTIIRNRFLDGLSYKELALKINVDIGQIGVRLGRCLGYLRKVLNEKGISWEDVL